MLNLNNLSAEDAAVIIELSQKIDIALAERIAKALTDKKFYIETKRGEKRLLVINTSEHYDWLEGDFRMCEYLAASGINVMQPVIMGTFSEGALAYQLYTWFDGEDLAEALTRMNHTEMFSAGKKTGEMLRKLHSLPPFEEDEPPLEFFRLLSYYLVFGALCDSRDYDYIGEDDQDWTKVYLNWFDDMRNPVPSWYPSQIE